MEGADKTIPLNFILEFSIISDFKISDFFSGDNFRFLGKSLALFTIFHTKKKIMEWPLADVCQ